MGYNAVEVMIGLQKGDLLDNEVYTETGIIEKSDLVGGEIR